MIIRVRIVCTLLSLLIWVTAPGVAQAQSALPDLSLEELMGMDAGRVFGASDRLQPVIEAPASVSFITAEEIARFGYRTLADILRGVRGFYVSDDRNFSLLGSRGFSIPGDYNSRILLLVNGHRVNDNVFGQAEIGAEFGIDAAMFERVEIIRGPAASLYGDSAFFAVINVITKRAAALDGLSLALDGGSLGTYLARASGGRRLAHGVDVAVAGTLEGSQGNARLFFPAFDTPATNNGVADGLDGEQLRQIYAQVTYPHLTLTGAYGTRRRLVPTASFQSLFHYQPDRERTTDRHTLADVEYVRVIGRARLRLRASFDRFSYVGVYPVRAPDGPESVAVGRNAVLGDRWTMAAQLSRPLPGRQLLTVGAEFIDNVQQHQQVRYTNPALAGFVSDRPSRQHAAFLQDELKLTRWLIANGGLRYDHYLGFSRVTPRTALIAVPFPSQSFKYLYGRAFRAPNAYERNTIYFGEAALDLGPEAIATHELVWERYAKDWLRTSVSAYWYQADRLITPTPTDDPAALFGTTLVNEGQVRARGLELETQMRLRGGAQGLVSYAWQRATTTATGASLVNSPRRLAKLRLSVPGPLAKSFTSVEVLYIGSRHTLGGDTLGDAVTANLTAIAPLTPAFDLVGNLRNLFNARYLDPVGDATDAIAQNGRTVRLGLRWKLGGTH